MARSTNETLRKQVAELAKQVADSRVSGIGTIRLDSVSVSPGIIYVNDVVALVKSGSSWYGVPKLARSVQRVLGYGNLIFKPIRSGLLAPARNLTRSELEYLVDSGSRDVIAWAKQELTLLANDGSQFVTWVSKFQRGEFTTPIHVYQCWDRYEGIAHPVAATHIRLSTGYTVPRAELIQVIECMFGLRHAYDVRILGYGSSKDASGLIKTGCHTRDMASVLACCWAIGWHHSSMTTHPLTRKVARAFEDRAKCLAQDYAELTEGITLPDVE
jgi:hypothetical protein